jgi:hypothetical protein
MKTIYECAQKYHDFSREIDIPIKKQLLSPNSANQLDALKSIAGRYKIARTFRRKFDIDIGLRRFEPVLKTLNKYRGISHFDVVALVVKVNSELALVYQRNTISAASKFLWFLFGQRIVIYDSRAVKSLSKIGFQNLKGNYAEFYSAWQNEFANKRDEIFNICKSEKFPTEEWFLERVFDFYLWINGGK